MPAKPANPLCNGADVSPREGWLRKHADYQRVYREGKRQSLPLMTYFFALRPSNDLTPDISYSGSRIGLTTGRVLGNAVERNRIKRRMRALVRQHRMELTAGVDVILHPRRTVLDAEFPQIERDVLRALRTVQAAAVSGTLVMAKATTKIEADAPSADAVHAR